MSTDRMRLNVEQLRGFCDRITYDGLTFVRLKPVSAPYLPARRRPEGRSRTTRTERFPSPPLHPVEHGTHENLKDVYVSFES